MVNEQELNDIQINTPCGSTNIKSQSVEYQLVDFFCCMVLAFISP